MIPECASLPSPDPERIFSCCGGTLGLRADYPATRYEPSPLVDLTSKAERTRLSPSAVRAFFNIAARWGIRDEDAKALFERMPHRIAHSQPSAIKV